MNAPSAAVYADDFTRDMSPGLRREYVRWYPFCKDAVLGSIDRLPQILAELWSVSQGAAHRFPETLKDAVLDPYRSYHIRSGKMVRPFLVCFLLRAFGHDPREYGTVVALAEIIHAASLILDDIADDSALRRGAPTLHRMVGVRVAGTTALAWLHACIPLLVVSNELTERDRSQLLHEIAWEHWVTGLGTTIDTTWPWRARFDATPSEYMQSVVHRSTSYTYRLPLKIGAIAAGATDEQRALLIAFGEEIGLAFQVMDDMLNVRSTDANWGKVFAEDVSEGKINLHVLLALERSSRAQAARLREILGSRTQDPQTLEEAVGIIERCGAFEAAGAIALAHVERTKAIATEMKFLSRDDRDALCSLVDYIVERSR